jgi:SAM-dependent methyltransferase
MVVQIQEIADRIQPDDPQAERHHSFGIANSIAVERRATDLWLAKRILVGKQARIADIGCIPPVFLTALRENGFDVEGVDLDPSRFSKSIEAAGLTVQRCNIETERLPYSDSSLDAVLFFEVFEHLRINLIFTMREIHRVLKPAGSLLLTTPNGLGLHGLGRIVWKKRIGPPIYRTYAQLETIGHTGHIREYSMHEVCAFLSEIGFLIEATSHRGRYQHPIFDFAIRLIPALRPVLCIVARKP